VSHCGLANLHLKGIGKAKEEELWKLKYFTKKQKYNLQKTSSKKKPKSFKIIIITLL
jgi:hypothetical protein